MDLQLTTQEHALLVTFLRERQCELLREISRTDVREFRHALREKEAILESMLRKLAPADAHMDAA